MLLLRRSRTSRVASSVSRTTSDLSPTLPTRYVYVASFSYLLFPIPFSKLVKKADADMEFLALGLRRRQGYQVYGRCGRVQKDCDARVASQVEALIGGLQN